MSDQPDESATQAPTEKRKRDARRKGDRPRSRDLAAALTTGFGIAGLFLVGGPLVLTLSGMLGALLGSASGAVDDILLSELTAPMIKTGVILLVILAGAVVAMIAGGPPSGALVAPQFNRLNPVTGFGRLFGSRGLIEAGISLLKVVIVGAIAWQYGDMNVAELQQLAGQSFDAAVVKSGTLLLQLLVHLGVGLAIIAAWDVPLRIWQWLGRVRMTLQQVREESRESDGAPELKGAQRQRMRAILNGGARLALKDATVVVVNPASIAVALRYRPEIDRAPTVVAKGRGATARALREMAALAAIPVLSQPPLARALYYTARTGDLVHVELYVAVATVIAWVLNVQASVAQDLNQVSVPGSMNFDAEGRRAPV